MKKHAALNILVGLLLGAAGALPLHAREATGASFLKIGVGARAAGMGSAYTSVANDVTAMNWNPGGLALLRQKEFSASHAQPLEQMSFDSFGYAHPFAWGTIGVGAVRLTQGTLEGRDVDRKKAEDFTAYDEADILSISELAGPGMGWGINLKRVHQSIADVSADGFAADLGLLKKISGSKISLGLAVQNLGPEMKFVESAYDLPLTVSGGISYNFAPLSRISVDARHYFYEGTNQVGVGFEMTPLPHILVRGGYSGQMGGDKGPSALAGSESNRFDKFQGFCTGVGINFQGYKLDYSFTPMGELGYVQRISLGKKFSSRKRP